MTWLPDRKAQLGHSKLEYFPVLGHNDFGFNFGEQYIIWTENLKQLVEFFPVVVVFPQP
jgi:hypothetical protein